MVANLPHCTWKYLEAAVGTNREWGGSLAGTRIVGVGEGQRKGRRLSHFCSSKTMDLEK